MRKIIELMIAATFSTVIGCQTPRISDSLNLKNCTDYTTPTTLLENSIEVHGYKTTQIALDYLQRVAAFKTGDFEIEADSEIVKLGPCIYHKLKFPLHFVDNYTPAHDPDGKALQEALYLADNPHQLFGPLAGSASHIAITDHNISRTGDKVVTATDAMNLYEITISQAANIIREKLHAGYIFTPKNCDDEEF